jgi:aldehyde dehydrogenase (NAD+)
VWHPGIDAITFSGSLAHGRMVMAACAERLLKCQIEMGGNNAAVVADDADAVSAADAILSGAFEFAGQRCTANRRVILLPGAREAFSRRLHARLGEWIPGDPSDESCRIGPVKDVEAADRIEGLLVRAAAAGARVTRAGLQECRALGQRYVAPALVEGAGEDAEIVREETFGPVLVVQEARDWDDALRLLNAVRQGLVASLFSRSDALWRHFKETARAGILRLNSATAGALNGLPFGGWKASGWGEAEHAEADALFFTRHQAWIQPKETTS